MPGCNCGSKNQSWSNGYSKGDSKPRYAYRSKPKITPERRGRDVTVDNHCPCERNIYIPFPVTNNCCDGPRILGSSQGNVEKACRACDNINEYF